MKKILAFIFSMVICLSFVACSSGNSTASKSTSSSGFANTANSGYSSTSSRKSFTNKYGTETTKCAHSGCNNYIASSGDTNCCASHSNKCLNCDSYIDEDAMYCMSCITKSSNGASSSSSNNKSSSASSASSSKNKCHYKENGEEVCNSSCQSGSNFCSYHTKYLNDIYDLFTGGN